MTNSNILFIGLDVHKESIQVNAKHEKTPWGERQRLQKTGQQEKSVIMVRLVVVYQILTNCFESQSQKVKPYIFAMKQDRVVMNYTVI